MFTSSVGSNHYIPVNNEKIENKIEEKTNKTSRCEILSEKLAHVGNSAFKAFNHMPYTLSEDSDDEGGAEVAAKTEKAPKDKKADKPEKKKEKNKKEPVDLEAGTPPEETKVKKEKKDKAEKKEKTEKKDKKEKAFLVDALEPPTLVVVQSTATPEVEIASEIESIEKIAPPKEKKEKEFKLKKIKQPFGLQHRAWLVAGMASIIFFCVVSRGTPALVSALTPGLMDYLRVTYKSLPEGGIEKRVFQVGAVISLFIAFASNFVDEKSLLLAIPFFAFAVAILIKSELNKAKPEKQIVDFFDPSKKEVTLETDSESAPRTLKHKVIALVDKAKYALAPEGISKNQAQLSYAGLQTLISAAFISKNWSSNVQAVSGTIFKSNMRLFVNKFFKQVTNTPNAIVRRTALAASYVLLPLMGGLSLYALRDNLSSRVAIGAGLTIVNTLGMDTVTRLIKGFLWDFSEELKYGKTEVVKEKDVTEHQLKDHFMQFLKKSPRAVILLATVFAVSYPLNELLETGTLPQAVIANIANEMVVLFKPMAKAFVGRNMSLTAIVPAIVLLSCGYKNEAVLSILPSLALFLGKDGIRPKSDLVAMQGAFDEAKDELSEKEVTKIQNKLDQMKAEASHIF